MTRRFGEAAETPAYQASTTVRKRQKARIATAMPENGQEARKRWRKVLRRMSLISSIVVVSGAVSDQ